MRIYTRLFFLFVLLLVASCTPSHKHAQSRKNATFMQPLPAVFQASLALKRCPPTSFELVLRPDGMYFLQMERTLSDDIDLRAEVGVWGYNEERKIVRLTSYDKAVRIFSVAGKRTLKLVKVSGGMMPSLVRYNFSLTDRKPRYDGVVRMQGMYSRKRGRGVFQECLSGAKFPLLSGGRAVDIEHAYQDILHGRSESLFVTLDMRLSSYAGRGDRLIPERSVAIDPYHTCAGKERRIATIANNRWYVFEIAGEALGPESISKAPFLKVQSGEQLIQGFAGCNNFTGSWLFADNDFVFSRIKSTRMACPVGMEVEDAFLQVLDNTRRYSIRGGILSLKDRQGKVLARLRYSRPLTDLDFRYLLSDLEEAEEEILLGADEVIESHSVETGGAVPDSVGSAPVREVNEKMLPLPEESAQKNPVLHEIKVLQATRKAAVARPTVEQARVQETLPVQQVQQVDPAPKVQEAPGVDKPQKVTEKKEEVQSSVAGSEEGSGQPVTQAPAQEVISPNGSVGVDGEKKEEGQKVQEVQAEPKPTSPPKIEKEEVAEEGNSQPAVQEVEEGSTTPEAQAPEVEASGADDSASGLPEIDEVEQEIQPQPQPQLATSSENGEQESNEDGEGDDTPASADTDVDADLPEALNEDVNEVPPTEPFSIEGEEVDGGNVQVDLAEPEVQDPVQTFPVSDSSCNQPWKTPLREITGQVSKVEIKSPPWTGKKGLHLNVESSGGSYVVHVFPEDLMAQCREVFHFEVGETVAVSGSEFRTGKGQGQLNICAATITRGDNVLQLRDPMTSTLDKRLCCQEMCREKCAGKPAQCMRMCLTRCNNM